MKRYLMLAAAAAITVAGANAVQAQKKAAASSTSVDRLAGKPNLNGIWQTINAANYNVEPHDSSTSKAGERSIGALAANHAGLGVVEGGEIPYTAEAKAVRDQYRASAPRYDPEAACYLPGIPRATYMAFPFQIIQGDKGDMLFVYEYASANRAIRMGPVGVPAIDTWMGTSYGEWEGDTLKVVTLSQSPGEYKAPEGEMMQNMTWIDRSGNYIGSHTTVIERFIPVDKNHMTYEVTIEDPSLFTRSWKMSMPLYRRMEANAELMDFRCVPYSEEFLYGDLHEKAAAGE